MADFISNFTIQELEKHEQQNLKVYYSALNHACISNPPPYGKAWFGEEYRRMAKDPSWFANLIISDVDLEGYSAKQLWNYAESISEPELSHDLRIHAVDESRHSRIFSNVLFWIFPTLANESLNSQLDAMSPKLNITDISKKSSEHNLMSYHEILNSLILVNLFEIKALVLQRLLQPTLFAYSTSNIIPKLQRVTNSLINDELRHIRYTAHYIEKAANEGYGDYIHTAMEDFQKYLNKITAEQFTT